MFDLSVVLLVIVCTGVMQVLVDKVLGINLSSVSITKRIAHDVVSKISGVASVATIWFIWFA